MLDPEKLRSSDKTKAFDATCKGPRAGKSFSFVPVRMIRADTLHDKIEEGLTIHSFSSRKLDSPDNKSTNDIDVKTVFKKQTMKNQQMSRDASSDSTSDSKKKYMVSILKKSRFAEEEQQKGNPEPGKSSTEENKLKKKIAFNENIQIKVVENWGPYNRDPSGGTTSCRCNIF